MKTVLLVTWVEGGGEDPRPVVVKTSPLPRLLGVDGVTLRRTVRVRSSDVVLRPLAHAPFLRHELTHVPQQPEGWLAWVGWLGRYLLRPSFRRQVEAEADRARTAAYPAWRWR